MLCSDFIAISYSCPFTVAFSLPLQQPMSQTLSILSSALSAQPSDYASCTAFAEGGAYQPYRRFFHPETGRLKDNERKDKVNEMFAAWLVPFSYDATCFIFLVTRSLFICFVFSYTLDAFAERLLHFLDILIEFDPKRQRSHVWIPSGFGKLGRKIMSKSELDHTVAPLAMGSSNDPTV